MKQEPVRTKLNMDQLEALFERYLPADILPQVKESLRELTGRNSQEQIWEFRDKMTGMYNAKGILKILEDWNRECLKTGEQIGVLCIDVDKLENINQIYGHSEGDVVVQMLGQILEDSVTDGEICGHLGGSEFVVLKRCERNRGAQMAESFLKDIKGRIGNYNRISGKEYSFHVSHSLSLLPPSPNGIGQEVLDKALTQKRLQSDSSRSPLGGGSPRQEDTEEHRKVSEIIDRNLFRYAFQPIVDAKSGDIYAYEALMRTSEEIPISPLSVLKYAGQDGRLYDIERATFFNVLEHISHLGDLGNRRFFINSISKYQLEQEDYERLRASYGHLFPQMIVEVTEQTELEDEVLDRLLKRSREDGFGLAIDDYGTGYSNTASLLRYLPNCVKIDRLLITGIQENPKKQHFVNNIITFAHDNGFLALAEGVEQAAELKAVIHMGVDLIQGYYTAKPAFELLDELPEELRNEIIKDNLNIHKEAQRKVYIVNEERELPLMQLALEQYTGIVISQPELTLIGNPRYPACIYLKIKDGTNCRLTLRDVSLESEDDLPCIDIGNDASLTLVLEGSNCLEKGGIRVPDGSSFRLEGDGNLTIRSKNIYAYGIGNDINSGVGSITCDCSGKLDISGDGKHCICIGGGIFRQGEGIRILKGGLSLTVTGEEAVGIGCCKGSIPIDIKSCNLHIDFRVAAGCAVGSLEDSQDTWLSNLSLVIMGAGGYVSGVGSPNSMGGKIHIESAKVAVQLNGQRVRLLGNEGGDLSITTVKANIELRGEGNNVLGIGSVDESAHLEARETTIDVQLQAAENYPIGVREENCIYEGGQRILKINSK